MKFEFSFHEHDNPDNFGYIVDLDSWPTVEDFVKALERLPKQTKIDSIKIWHLVGNIDSLPSTKL